MASDVAPDKSILSDFYNIFDCDRISIIHVILLDLHSFIKWKEKQDG